MGDFAATAPSFPPDAGRAADPVLGDAATSTVAAATLFGSILFGAASVAARLWLTGTWRWRARAPGGHSRGGDRAGDGAADREAPRALDVASLPSLYRLLHHSAVFGLLLLYSYICERHPPYFHEEKTYDRDEVSGAVPVPIHCHDRCQTTCSPCATRASFSFGRCW